MAGMYDKFKKLMIDNDLDITAGSTLKAVLIDDADYTPNFNTDDFYDDVPSGAKVGTPVALASKTSTDGVFDAANTVLTTVTGDQCESVLLFNDTGSAATSALVLLLLALASAVTPNGGSITIAWDNGTNRIFKLTG